MPRDEESCAASPITLVSLTYHLTNVQLQVLFLALGYAVMCGVQFIPEGDEKVVPNNTTLVTLGVSQHFTPLPVN